MLESPEYLKHRKWMNHALELAKVAGAAGEVPVGAVIVDTDNLLVAVGENRKEREQDPTAHAEIIAIGLLVKTYKVGACINVLYMSL